MPLDPNKYQRTAPEDETEEEVTLRTLHLQQQEERRRNWRTQGDSYQSQEGWIEHTIEELANFVISDTPERQLRCQKTETPERQELPQAKIRSQESSPSGSGVPSGGKLSSRSVPLGGRLPSGSGVPSGSSVPSGGGVPTGSRLPKRGSYQRSLFEKDVL